MKPVISEHDEQEFSYGKYVLGFVISIALTVTAYLLATRSGAGKGTLEAILAGLAVVQFLVQMIFFLHLGDERKPRWKLGMAGLMLAIVLIVVFGSIWIMNNLNYRMTPEQMDQYLRSQDSL